MLVVSIYILGQRLCVVFDVKITTPNKLSKSYLKLKAWHFYVKRVTIFFLVRRSLVSRRAKKT